MEARENRGGATKRRFGILREFFPAFSRESRLLRLADNSSSVIEIHVGTSIEKTSQTENETIMLRDKLILKGPESIEEQQTNSSKNIRFPPYREHTPELLVSPHWLDLTRLSSGDRVIVSNPREEYEMPPPLAHYKWKS